MNPKYSTRETHSQISYFARRASAVAVLATLAMTGLACSGAPAGTASGAEATAATHEAETDPWPTKWTITATDDWRAPYPLPSPPRIDVSATQLEMSFDITNPRDVESPVQATMRFETKAPATADIFFTWDYAAHNLPVEAWTLGYVRAFADGPNGIHNEIQLVGNETTWADMPPDASFSNKLDTALRVYEGFSYGFIIGDQVGVAVHGSLKVPYRVEKISRTDEFGGWGESIEGKPNFDAMAPPGEYITEVAFYWHSNPNWWETNVITGISWAYSDGSCRHAGPCSVGTVGVLGKISEGNMQLYKTDVLGTCVVRRKLIIIYKAAFEPVTNVVMTKHPAMDRNMVESKAFGGNYDDEWQMPTEGQRLVGFHGIFSHDWLTSLGFYTRALPE